MNNNENMKYMKSFHVNIQENTNNGMHFLREEYFKKKTKLDDEYDIKFLKMIHIILSKYQSDFDSFNYIERDDEYNDREDGNVYIVDDNTGYIDDIKVNYIEYNDVHKNWVVVGDSRYEGEFSVSISNLTTQEKSDLLSILLDDKNLMKLFSTNVIKKINR